MWSMLSAVSTQPAPRRSQLIAGLSSVVGLRSPWARTPSHLGSITMHELFPEVDADTLGDILPLTRSTALAVPAIAAARHKVVTAIAGLPLVPVRQVTDAPALFTRLDPGRPNVITIAYMVDAMFFYGRAWLHVIARDATPANRPLALRWVDEGSIRFDSYGRPTHVGELPVQSSDLILVEHIAEGVLSPSAGLTIRRARRADSAAARAMDNPVPSVELHQTVGDPMDDDDIDKMIAGWTAARRGQNGGVAYTSPAIEAKMHGQAAEQLLINGRNASAIDCARVCGVPAWAVDAQLAGSSLTYSNVPSRSRELLDYTLRGYLDSIAGRLSLDDVTPHGQGLRFDVSRLLRGDFASRMAAGKDAVTAGIYTGEELRDMDSDTPTHSEVLP